jgi:hypothetical protein
MTAEQLRMNALRMTEAMQRLDKSIEILGEINLSRISGMSRAELSDYRAGVKAARDHITLAREHLAELEKARRKRAHAPSE